MTLRLALICAAIASAGAPALAQHGQHGSTSQPGHHGSAPQASSYAGQQSREIKALSDKEIQDLLAGAGMGFAKSAELNRHPGPMHALDHAAALELTQAQREQLSELLTRHKARARELGARVVELERELDGLFAKGGASAESVDRATAAIGEATARLRGEHLKTHLETKSLLSPAQVDRYVRERGY